MAGFLARGAASFGRPLIKPAIGAGIGFATEAADRAFDDEENVFESPSSYLTSGILGSLMMGSGRLGSGAAKGLQKARVPAGIAGKIGTGIKAGGTAGGFLGIIGSLFDGEDGPVAHAGKPHNGTGSFAGPLPGMPTAGGFGGGVGSGLFDGGVYGNLGAPPEFNRSLDDYMSDPNLINLANQQIIAQNNAIGRVNRDIRTELGRSLQGNAGAGAAAQQQFDRIRGDNLRQSNSIQSNARENQSRVVEAADRVAEDVGASIINDDHTRHDVQAEQAQHNQDVADRQAADSKLLERLASSSQDALATIAGADAQSTRSNAQNLRTKAIDQLQSNRREAAGNWDQKTGILGSLADTSMQRDLQAHQIALQGWGAKMDALTQSRNQQMEMQKLQASQSGQGSLDASMVNALLGIGQAPTGMSYNFAGPDGTDGTYKEPASAQWSDEQRDYYNQYLSGMLGLPEGFTFFDRQPVPAQKQDKFGPWR